MCVRYVCVLCCALLCLVLCCVCAVLCVLVLCLLAVCYVCVCACVLVCKRAGQSRHRVAVRTGAPARNGRVGCPLLLLRLASNSPCLPVAAPPDAACCCVLWQVNFSTAASAFKASAAAKSVSNATKQAAVLLEMLDDYDELLRCDAFTASRAQCSIRCLCGRSCDAPSSKSLDWLIAGRAVGLSCLTLTIGRFSRDYRELRFKHTIIPLP